MKLVTLTFAINDKNCIKDIVIDINETDLPNDSNLIKTICWTAVKAIHNGKEDIAIQDLLNELGIKKQ